MSDEPRRSARLSVFQRHPVAALPALYLSTHTNRDQRSEVRGQRSDNDKWSGRLSVASATRSLRSRFLRERRGQATLPY
jgi:hypothetical protein